MVIVKLKKVEMSPQIRLLQKFIPQWAVHMEALKSNET